MDGLIVIAIYCVAGWILWRAVRGIQSWIDRNITAPRCLKQQQQTEAHQQAMAVVQLQRQLLEQQLREPGQI